ncbi:MAG: Ig-like domain-containing protein [Nitrospirae bacterium]|nr:Ig-like domain-containing protein [Nitrospirota bacterium]
MCKFLVCITLLLILSCSSEKPADISSQKPSEAVRSHVSETSQAHVSVTGESYSIEIAPIDASRNSVIYVIPRRFNLTDAKIEWLVNGILTNTPVADQFKATETKKGDEVQAVAWRDGQKIKSNIIQITNSPPEISKVRILPEVFKPGDTLYVEASGSDLDGDEVTINYEWTKNGEPAGNDKKIETSLQRGDKVSVKITPYDGEAHGRPVILHREIVNIPPTIIESKNYNFDGKTYTHQVKATDPDGDPLTYSLKSAPAGMTINPSTGLIQWNVPPDFKGKAPITVSVTDGHGGEAMQSFTLEITPEK